MTPKIDLQPSASTSAATLSRQRQSSADSADDPFAACLESAAQQTRQSASQQDNAPREPQLSVRKSGPMPKPSTQQSRRKSVAEKTSASTDAASNPSAIETVAPPESAPPQANDADLSASHDDRKTPDSPAASAPVSVVQTDPELQASAAAVAAAMVAAKAVADAETPASGSQPQTVPPAASSADKTSAPHGRDITLESHPAKLPATQKTGPAGPGGVPSASPTLAAKGDSPTAIAHPGDPSAASTTARDATTDSPSPRARSAKEAEPALTVSREVAAVKTPSSGGRSETPDNPASDQHSAPPFTAPRARQASKAADTVETGGKSSEVSVATAGAAPAAESPAVSTDLSAADSKPALSADIPAPSSIPPIAPLGVPTDAGVALQSASGSSAKSASAAQDSPASASDSTYDQVVLGLRTKMDAANQKAEMDLNPPNLGRLHVSVEVSNGLLTAQFRASSDVVRDLLSSKMDHLRSVLEGQGITVDKLAVSTTPTPSTTGGEFRPTTSAGTEQHDGRSGGAFAQDRQTPRQNSGEAFSQMWRAALGKEQPIDLLA
jgi:flagellar hook-length control protein FliK